MRYLIVGGGLLIAGPWFGVCLVIWQDRLAMWLTALPVWLVVSSLIAIWLHLPMVQHERQSHITDIERLKTDAHQLRQARLSQTERDPISVDAEAERRYRWHRFWSDCLQYAAECNSFAYRGCFENVLDHKAWRAGFADPLVRARWLEPVQSSIKTKPMPEWTATRMLRELAAGTPPPYPDGEPPEWKQTSRENTQKHSENTSSVFATDVREH
jgi:hypothetical protein